MIAVLVFAVLWVAVVRIPPFFLFPLVWIFVARGHRGRGAGFPEAHLAPMQDGLEFAVLGREQHDPHVEIARTEMRRIDRGAHHPFRAQHRGAHLERR